MAELDVPIAMEQLKPVGTMAIGQPGQLAVILIVEAHKQGLAHRQPMAGLLAAAQAHNLVRVPKVILVFIS
jgi:hypothetical protein